MICNHNKNMKQEKETRNFIITVTRNYTINYLKKQKQNQEEYLEEQIPVPSSDVLDKIVLKETMKKLKDEIHMLDEKYKSVLELKYVIGFTNDEIAELLGITKKNVQTRLYRAKNLLRSKLGENIDV